MYKVLVIVLAGAFLFAFGMGTYKTWQANKEINKLSNQLAKSQKLEQETKSAYSIAAQKLKNLEVQNKELQDKIEGRDESVAALGQANLRLKDQLFKIKNAKLFMGVQAACN